MSMNGIFWEGDFRSSCIALILKEIYLDRVYAPFLEGRRDLTIIDAGANIGLFSMYAAPFAKRIIAIEPSYALCECFIKTVVNPDVYLERSALSDKDLPLAAFYAFPGNGTMGTLQPGGNGWQGTDGVETITLKTLFRKYDIDHVDFMKLDIEGGEAAVLRSPEFAEVAPRIDTIVGEWHNWSDMSKAEIAQRLNSCGFDFRWIERRQEESTMFAATRRPQNASTQRSIYAP